MALKSFNVAKGLSVGAVATDVIDQNANITAAALTANGNVSFTGADVSLGAVANLHVTGGTSGQFLTTDGSGGLSFATVDVANATVESANTANVAYSVDGANVSGPVTAANEAYSVDLANVVGAGNIASIDLNGNGSQALLGNGAWGQVSSYTSSDANAFLSSGDAGPIVAQDITSIGVISTHGGFLEVANATGSRMGRLYASQNWVTLSTDGARGVQIYPTGTGAQSWNFTTNGNIVFPDATVQQTAWTGVAPSANTADVAYSVDGANVVGEVANATYATTAGTAYSVSGANVSGEVANAGYATYAGTAYSVAGGNVSGTVANATFATSAGSVDGANVSGEVAQANFATYSSQADTAAGLDAALVNVVISGGSSGQVLATDGSGSLSWVSISTVGSANYANYAGEAFSVSGANVSGQVYSAQFADNATSALTADTAYSIDGSNVVGTVAEATTAYNIDGANVIGPVASATNASSADYVAGFNVDGTVTSASVAYSVDGANVVGTVSAASVAYSVDGGNIFGIVMNAQQAMNADTANTAGYVTFGNQSNITQVGILANLDVTDYANIGGHLTAAGANINGDMGVSGNLTVTGNLVYLDVQNTTVSDPLLTLAANNSSDLVDIGIVGTYNGNVYSGLARDHNDGTWKLFVTTTQPDTTVDYTTLADLSVRNAYLTEGISADGEIHSNNAISADGTVSGANFSTSGIIEVGTAVIKSYYTFTTSTSATSLGKYSVSPGQALQFTLRGADQSAPKYSTASALVLTDGTGTVDYTLYGALDMGGGAGVFTFASADGGANVEMFVTATSSNSTYWSTQVNVI